MRRQLPLILSLVAVLLSAYVAWQVTDMRNVVEANRSALARLEIDVIGVEGDVSSLPRDIGDIAAHVAEICRQVTTTDPFC